MMITWENNIKQTVMALPATLIPAEGQKTYSNDKHNLIYITTWYKTAGAR
jgi:hypothetical protein